MKTLVGILRIPFPPNEDGPWTVEDVREPVEDALLGLGGERGRVLDVDLGRDIVMTGDGYAVVRFAASEEFVEARDLLQELQLVMRAQGGSIDFQYEAWISAPQKPVWAGTSLYARMRRGLRLAKLRRR